MKTTLFACFFFTTFLYGQCPNGDVTFNSQADVNNFVATFPNCDNINGDLFITGSVNNLSALDYLVSIEGHLIIRDTQLTSISNFNSLGLVLNNIEISENTILKEVIGFNALIDLAALFKIENNANLVTINGFNKATDVFGDFWINGNTSLQLVNGFNSLTNVFGLFGINDSPILISIPSFNNLKYISWSIQFFNTGLTALSGFDNLTSIGSVDPTSGFNISNNQNLVAISGFNCLKSIVFDFLIQENPLLTNIMGLSSLESVGQFFTIRNNGSLATLNGLQNLISVSTTGYETTVVFEIHDNPQLSDCDPLCNLLSSNGIIGLTNITSNLIGCNSETEINTSSCIPFDFLNCTNLIDPANGDLNVEIDTNISWTPITAATSYFISIGTTPEGSQIANNLNVGNITNYDLPVDLPENTEIFVKVKPSNNVGQAKCCTEESFTTINTTLDCTQLITPFNNATDVSVTSNIIWDSVLGATGYLISVGTFSGATDIANGFDVGSATTFNPPVNLPENTTIFVTITPYKASGNSMGCIEEKFSTQAESLDCSSLLNPTNGATNISVSTILTWNISPKASGYILNIGLTPTGSEIINNLDIGNVTSYNGSTNFPFSTILYISVKPYNSLGQAQTCEIESFTTGVESIFVPRFFTPNNDAYNDIWHIKDPLNEIEMVYIYNRYGKLLKTLSHLQMGWDGLFNNQFVPVNDYWYVIKLKNGNQVNGHFTLKR